MEHKDRLWREFQQVGTDYESLDEIAAYDARMASFRNVDAENRGILDTLALTPGAKVLEIGCGTGRFARAAAREGLSVTAVDVSQGMLEYVKQKTDEENLPDIVLRHAGFLSIDFDDDAFDAVVTSAALHHLPDAWKFVALRNIARILKPRGQFILRDVVFILEDGDTSEDCFERFAQSVGEMRLPAARHIATEFSTYDWIMEGLLQRAGLDIVSQISRSPSFIEYHCRKATP